ncbi:MAG: hypothetical protein NC483_07430 [Ruminococcus sp.]|nr:hypothetical protein [Ruminococcus sp.]
MKKKGFASMFMVYSFFLIFILMMGTALMINTYKKNFLNALKNDIKLDLKNYHLPVEVLDVEDNEED